MRQVIAVLAALGLAGAGASSCTLAVNPVSFGPYLWTDAYSSALEPSPIRLTCAVDANSSVTVSLSADAQHDAAGNRRLFLKGIPGGNALVYQLKLLPSNAPWGSGPNGATFTQTFANPGGAGTQPASAGVALVATAAAGQFLVPGPYSNTITVTLDLNAP